MFESPSRIILGIVGVCLLLTLLVIFRPGGGDEETESGAPRPGSVTSMKLKPGQQARRDEGGNYTSGDGERPRGLPPSSLDAARPGSLSTGAGKPEAAAEPLIPEAAAGSGRNLAAEPVPVPPAGAGILPAGGPVAGSPEALAAIPSAPADASLAVPFNGNGESLGNSAVPLVDENVVYDVDEGAYFPPDARFAFGDSGSVKNNAGTIAFWMKPNWDGSDPRNASLVQFRTDDWNNRLQIFKNGRYLRYLFTDNTGTETNLNVDMQAEQWAAGDWHHIAITWGDSLISMYSDGAQRQQGTYFGDLEIPTGTELYLGSDRPGGNPGADATLQDFVVLDRAAEAAEIMDMFDKGRDS